MITKEMYKTLSTQVIAIAENKAGNADNDDNFDDNLTKGLKVFYGKTMRTKEPAEKFNTKLSSMVTNLQPLMEEFNMEEHNGMVTDVLHRLAGKVTDAFSNFNDITTYDMNTQFWDDNICHSVMDTDSNRDHESRIAQARCPEAKHALEHFTRGIPECAFSLKKQASNLS